ncbi:MAG: hypothetical protein IJO29_01120 [Oscillospiraceae bacterium]|nr:hypothetical protein [Oscillospiraceae bacterium]
MENQQNFCVKCGGKLVNGICANCNNASTNFVSEQQAANTAPVYDSNLQPQQAQQSVQSVNEMRYNVNNGAFISPEEYLVYKIGNSYAQSYMMTSNVTKDSVAVTNKRVYYSGKTYLGARRYKTTLVADLKEISCVGIYKSFNLLMLIISILLVLTGLYLGTEGSAEDLVPFLVIGGIIGIIWVMATAKTLLKIDYAGGCIAMDIKSFSSKELGEFRSALYRAKDLITKYN